MILGHDSVLSRDIPSVRVITQLICQKVFRAMIMRVSRNPARNNSSEIFWRNDAKAIEQTDA